MDKKSVGLDIAKLSFVAAINVKGKCKAKSFKNNDEGFEMLMTWLRSYPAEKYHFCMEATGKYGNALALFLYNNKHIVSVVNPAKIKFFMQSCLSRNKTDPIDAKFICHYCEVFPLLPWQPLSPERQTLQVLIKRIDELNKFLLQDRNRLELADSAAEESINEHVTFLKSRIKEIEGKIKALINSHPTLKEESKLLRSIPGVGPKTTRKTLAFLSHIKDFKKANQVAAFIGISPQRAQSGTSLNRCHISKTGDAELRKMLYMPALVAIQHQPSIKIFYEKLLAKGKPHKVAICAVMRRLIHIIYGVLKSQKPFDPTLIMAA